MRFNFDWTRRSALAFILAAGALALFSGCLSQSELIEKRIAKKSGFFTALPPEAQQRIRGGGLQAGDSRDAAWIVYGQPDRIYQKVTAAATNEVWAYVAQDAPGFSDEPRPVYHPVHTSRGWLFWNETFWAPSPDFDFYEYRRIEFEGGRVLAIESQQP